MAGELERAAPRRPDSEVIGREDELARVRAFLDGLVTHRVLLIEGEAGVGKTSVWREAVAEAHDRGYRVLESAPARAEAQLSFTVLRDLLATAFADVEDALPAPQRHALAVTLLREEPTDLPPDAGSIAVALLGALEALADDGPTLLAIDDVQWLDRASATHLSYALRRLAPARVRAVLACRSHDDSSLPLELDRLEPGALATLRLGPLTVGALARVIYGRLGVAYPRPTARRLHEASAGNAFYALELARALGTVDRPLRRGASLPVPATLVRDRLAALPAETLDALLVLAAASRPSLALVGATLERDPLPSLEPSVAADVVVIDGDDVRFAHPLFAAAIYDRATERARREVHAALARVVRDREEQGRHLAAAAALPDEAIASRVEDAASAAHARGSPAAAAELAAEARRLTPPDDAEALRTRGLAEADYQFAAGDTRYASALLDELLATAPVGTPRATLLSRKARIHHFAHDIGVGVELLRAALEEAGDEAALRAEIEEGLAWGLLLVRRDLRAALEHARSAATFAELAGGGAPLAEALAAEGLLAFVVGEPPSDAMERALALEESTLHLRVLRHPSFAHGYCLSCADEIDAARATFEELRRRAEERGDHGSLPSILNHLAQIETLSGRWDDAERLADEAFQLALEAGQAPTQASTLAKRALLAARRGDASGAQGYARRSFALMGRPEAGDAAWAMAHGAETALWALGTLELARGDGESAYHHLGPLAEGLLAAGVEEPGEIRSLPDAVEALVLCGRGVQAEPLVERLEGWAERLDRSSARALAHRCSGLVLAAEGDATEALAAFEAAERTPTPLPFERARTLLAVGTAQRRARQRKNARETLREALAIFDDLRAEPWSARARAELARVGGRRDSGETLTPAEQRIAQLVAEGKTNREVADALVVTVHTVEAALTRVYRKLGVRSRTELARRFDEVEPSKL